MLYEVITQVPCTPKAAKVFRSAAIPAPPPESEPAIVITIGVFDKVFPVIMFLRPPLFNMFKILAYVDFSGLDLLPREKEFLF